MVVKAVKLEVLDHKALPAKSVSPVSLVPRVTQVNEARLVPTVKSVLPVSPV